MKTDLQAGQISGTLPILYVFLARSGMTVKSMSPIPLDDQGAAYFAGENAGTNAVRGVRIIFAGSDAQEKTLYYFSTDLSNSGAKTSGFLKFCATLAPGSSLIKSASYLLHSGNFTTVRDFLLNNSATIIQDDSGIPLGYYSTKKWRLFPFGRYLGPIDEFPGTLPGFICRVVPAPAQPIDFGIGYRWRTDGTNRICCCRCDYLTTARPVPMRRHRPNRRRPRHRVRESPDHRRMWRPRARRPPPRSRARTATRQRMTRQRMTRQRMTRQRMTRQRMTRQRMTCQRMTCQRCSRSARPAATEIRPDPVEKLPNLRRRPLTGGPAGQQDAGDHFRREEPSCPRRSS